MLSGWLARVPVRPRAPERSREGPRTLVGQSCHNSSQRPVCWGTVARWSSLYDAGRKRRSEWQCNGLCCRPAVVPQLLDLLHANFSSSVLAVCLTRKRGGQMLPRYGTQVSAERE